MIALKPSDALELVALVVERWPASRLSAEQMKRYAEDLAGLDADSASAALEALYRSGRQFAPTAGELRREAARLELGAPDWAEVKRQLIERHVRLQTFTPQPWTCPHERCDGSGWVVHGDRPGEREAARCECFEARRIARRMAETLHPLVREFIDGSYVSWAEVEVLGAAGGTRDALTLEAQAREKWNAYASRAVESRAFASIGPGADLPRLVQAREEDAPRARSRGQLRQLDVLEALPSPPEAA